MSPAALTMVPSNKEKVCLIGSGNWGSTIAKIVGHNVLKYPAQFDAEVKMYVHEEMIDGEPLTKIINEKHENIKYLPGIKLPANVRANPDLIDTCHDATILVFVMPHQFVKKMCIQMQGKIPANAKAISLIKGVDISEKGLVLMSNLIRDNLGGINVCTLSGANIANEIANENFAETTIGYTNEDNAKLMKAIFETPYFRVNCVPDVAGVEICGALKNIVALGAGFVDGLRYGDNCKAAIIRLGLLEMRKFAKKYCTGVRDETFLESCGVADLITTCAGGRNRKVAEAMVTTGKPLAQLEQEMLNGQMLQGTGTAKEVYTFLSSRGEVDEFPLFTKIYKISFESMPASQLVRDL